MLEKTSNIRKFGNSVCVIIPSGIWNDSNNKFEMGQEVNVKLDEKGEKLEIKR